MKIDEKSALLSERREVLDELKIKNRLAKEKLVNILSLFGSTLMMLTCIF